MRQSQGAGLRPLGSLRLRAKPMVGVEVTAAMAAIALNTGTRWTGALTMIGGQQLVLIRSGIEDIEDTGHRPWV